MVEEMIEVCKPCILHIDMRHMNTAIVKALGLLLDILHIMCFSALPSALEFIIFN